MYLEVTALSA